MALKTVTVATKIKLRGIVEQTTTVIEGGYEEVTKHVLRTEDAQVRAALMEMGWTPPPEYGLDP